MMRLMNRPLSRCWETWADMAKAAVRTRDAMSTCSRRSQSSLKQGWNSWHELYVETVRTRDTMLYFANLILRRTWHGAAQLA